MAEPLRSLAWITTIPSFPIIHVLPCSLYSIRYEKFCTKNASQISIFLCSKPSGGSSFIRCKNLRSYTVLPCPTWSPSLLLLSSHSFHPDHTSPSQTHSHLGAFVLATSSTERALLPDLSQFPLSLQVGLIWILLLSKAFFERPWKNNIPLLPIILDLHFPALCSLVTFSITGHMIDLFIWCHLPHLGWKSLNVGAFLVLFTAVSPVPSMVPGIRRCLIHTME